MGRRFTRAFLRALAAIVVVLAALVAVVLWTPSGVRLGVATGWPRAAGDSGLSLRIGSAHGSLARGVSLKDVTVTDGGVVLFEAARVTARVEDLEPLGRSLRLADLRLEGCEVLLETDEDGELVGWSRLRRDDPERDADDSEQWDIALEGELSDVTVVVRDAATGFDLVARSIAGSVGGTTAAADARLTGSLSIMWPALRESLKGEFDVAAGLREERYLTLEPLTVDANAGRASATGVVDLLDRSMDLEIESSHELAELVPLFAAEEEAGVSGGRMTLDTRLTGPTDSLTYASDLRAEDVLTGPTRLDVVTARVTGDRHGLSTHSLRAEALGGALDAALEMVFPDPEDADLFPLVSLEGDFDGVDLARVAALAPAAEATRAQREASGARPDATRRRPAVEGTAGGTLTMEWASPGPTGLTAGFEVRSHDLTVSDRELGEASATGSINGGLLTVDASCVGATASAVGELGDDGLHRADVALRADDLSVIGLAAGAEGLEGSASAELLVTVEEGGLALEGSASSGDLRMGGVQAAPLEFDVSTKGDEYHALFQLFDSAVSGTGVMDASGAYSASFRTAGFDLATLVPDSLRENMQLAGRASLSAALTGTAGGSFLLEGDVSELNAAVRRQNAELTAPFRFTATPDSVWLSEAAFTGTFGELSVAGSYTTSGAIDAVATFGAAELYEICELLPRVPDVRPNGQLAGEFRLSGHRRAPAFSAEVALRAFEMSGLEVESVVFEAEGDSSDVIFDLAAVSAQSGDIWAGGSVPVRPDSISVLRFDAGREFGVSVLASDFVLDAGEAVLPDARGEKVFRFDGSALLTGTADSLTSINGSGLLSRLTAEFAIAGFTMTDTVYFEVRDGLLEFEQLVIDVTRRKALGDPAGGRLTLEGSIAADGEVDLRAETEDLDVGHLTRALGRSRGLGFHGTMGARATVTGSSRNPSADIEWEVDAPGALDLGFERAEGRVTYDDGVLFVETAELASRGSAVRVTGRVRTRRAGASTGAGPGSGAGAGEATAAGPALDLRITADDFRLDDIVELPPDIEKLEGRLDIDMRVAGRPDSLSPTGSLTLRRGRMEGFDLATPVRDIEVDVEAGGSTVALRRVHARAGDGSAEAAGLLDLSAGLEDATFLWVGSLDSAEFEVNDLGEGRVSADLSWGGTPSRSTLRGTVTVEKAKVTKSVGLAELVGRGPRAVVIRRAGDPRADIDLDLDIVMEDEIEIDSNVAELSLGGGASIGGTMLAPRVSGSVHADRGKLSYLRNDFELEGLSVIFDKPERRDPYVTLTGKAEVESRSGEEYTVTAAVDGYLSESGVTLTSVPALNRADIVTLLTFGDTFGGLVGSDETGGTSGDAFKDLARRAFVSSAFGLAERSLEQMLGLDTVDIDEEQVLEGNAAGADVTLGKEFGGRVSVNYTTAVGRFSSQRVEVSFELLRRLWLAARTNPEGNHAVGLKLQIPFR